MLGVRGADRSSDVNHQRGPAAQFTENLITKGVQFDGMYNAELGGRRRRHDVLGIS